MFAIEFRFAEVPDASRFEDFLDCVADELVARGVEPDYTASVSELSVTWAVEVPDSSEGSLINALAVLQEAMAAADGVRHEVVSARQLTAVAVV